MEETRKRVLAISGSTRQASVNHAILKFIQDNYQDLLAVELYDELTELPHFNPDVTDAQLPAVVTTLRAKVAAADGIIICTPEYVFSLPGALKNLLEWTVATTVFDRKPVAVITASALGEKAHEQLRLILDTFSARIGDGAALLISGARSKVNAQGQITDNQTSQAIDRLIQSFCQAMEIPAV